MKIALCTDTHFGARNDSLAFNEFFYKFWEGTFFPYLEEHNIKEIIHLGDFVDRRKFINYPILSDVRKRFFDVLERRALYMDVIVGNHDVPYRNSNDINAINELFGKRKNVHVYSHATSIIRGGCELAIIPWINNSNYHETKSFIQSTTATIAMGHLEIPGFQMDRGTVCTTGIPREEFSKFETVYTGHFHHRSTDGHIFYLGNTYEITWADYGDSRGFHVFDTETRDVEFIENPYHMFFKIEYDEGSETFESVSNRDFSQYTGTIVKIVMKTRNDSFLFDTFMDNLYKAQPIDVSIVEDFTVKSEAAADDVDQADTTTTILDKVVDALDIADKPRMKNLFRDIYHQALSNEVDQED